MHFDAEDATLTETNRVVDEGDPVGVLPIPVKAGARFFGWFDPNGNLVDEDTVFKNGHVTLTAEWVEQITVTFEADGVEISPRTTVIDKGAAVGALPVLTKEGYVFRGWFTEQTGGEQVTDETKFYCDTTLYAHFAKKVAVTFVYADENNSQEVVLAEDTPIAAEQIPAATPGADCSFDGWYSDNANWSPNTKVVAGTTVFTQDTTVYAHYTVAVTFVVKDGEGNTPLSTNAVHITKGTALGDVMPQDPVLNGYRFVGWFENGAETPITPSQTFSSDTTVTAKFSKQVTIAFLTNGTRHEFVVDSGATVALIENPLKQDARFDGWFVADSNGDPTGRRVTNDKGLVNEQGELITDRWIHRYV